MQEPKRETANFIRRARNRPVPPRPPPRPIPDHWIWADG
jgi:hypothetical protein